MHDIPIIWYRHLEPRLDRGVEGIDDRQASIQAINHGGGVEEIGVSGACQEPETVQERQEDDRVKMDAGGEQWVSEICISAHNRLRTHLTRARGNMPTMLTTRRDPPVGGSFSRY